MNRELHPGLAYEQLAPSHFEPSPLTPRICPVLVGGVTEMGFGDAGHVVICGPFLVLDPVSGWSLLCLVAQ